MTGAQIVAQTIELFPENELILASKLYTERLSNTVGENAYYQSLGRMCKAGKIWFTCLMCCRILRIFRI